MPRSRSAGFVPEAAISTNVPSKGRQRRISLLERDLIKCQKAFHAVGDVTATQSCSTDVLDVAVEFERRFACLTDKLGMPFLIANLITVGLAVIHDFNLFDRAVRVQTDCIGDKLVFADNFVDDKPTAAAYAPDPLLAIQDADAASLLNGFALNAR